MKTKLKFLALSACLFSAAASAASDGDLWLHLGGFTKHFPFKDYNETNPGIGIEYKNHSIDLMNESFGHPMFSYSYRYPILKKRWGTLGIVSGISYRSFRDEKTETKGTFSYIQATNTEPAFFVKVPTGTKKVKKYVYRYGLCPHLALSYSTSFKNLGFNLLYLPEIKVTKNYQSPSLFFLQFKVKM